MQAKGQKTAVSGRLIGYARVSTEEQGPDPQLDDLRAACATVLEEYVSVPIAPGRCSRAGCAASGSARPWSWSGSTASPARSATLAVIASQRSSESTNLLSLFRITLLSRLMGAHVLSSARPGRWSAGVRAL